MFHGILIGVVLTILAFIIGTIIRDDWKAEKATRLPPPVGDDTTGRKPATPLVSDKQEAKPRELG